MGVEMGGGAQMVRGADIVGDAEMLGCRDSWERQTKVGRLAAPQFS